MCVLAVVAGALGGWLRSRGIRTDGLEMRALVPVSVRSQGEHGTLGNRLTAMRGPLPGLHPGSGRAAARREPRDGRPQELQAGGRRLDARGGQRHRPAGGAGAGLAAAVLDAPVQPAGHQHPGPQVPLYILGNKLQDLFPLAFLPQGHALAVAIMSYNGRVEYGLLGDFDALPDIDLIAAGIDERWRSCWRPPGRTTAAAGRRNGAKRRCSHVASAGTGRSAGRPPTCGPSAPRPQTQTQGEKPAPRKTFWVEAHFSGYQAYTRHIHGASPNPSSSRYPPSLGRFVVRPP